MYDKPHVIRCTYRGKPALLIGLIGGRWRLHSVPSNILIWEYRAHR